MISDPIPSRSLRHAALEPFQTVEAYSWGNAGSVSYLMNGMMVTTQEAIDAGAFDLRDVEKFAISVWAYAWK